MTIVQPALAPPRIVSDDAPDGSRILRSEMPLEPYEASLGVLLRRWGKEAPDRVFLAERDGDSDWIKLTWGEANRKASARRPGAARPRPRAAAPAAAALGQRDRPRAADARRLPRRRTRRAGLAGVLADEPGLRQGQAHRGAGQAGARLRGRRRDRSAACSPPSTSAARRSCSPAATARRRSPSWSDTRPTAAVEEALERGRPRQHRQDPVHVGLDGDAQGRAQHARDAVRQPAEPRADLAVHGRHAAGARRLAAVEPHVRRQPQLQPDPQARRDDVHRRRPPGAAADADHGAQPDRDRADDLLQRARGLRRAAAVPGARRRAARALLRAPGPDLLRRRRAAAGSVDAAGGGRSRGARRAGDDDLLLGADRDVAAGHRRALPDRPRGRDRRAGARAWRSSSRRSRASSRCASRGRTSPPATSASPS